MYIKNLTQWNQLSLEDKKTYLRTVVVPKDRLEELLGDDIELWNIASSRQGLTEEIIERHLDLVDWDEISRYNLTENFIRKYFKKLDFEELLLQNKLSTTFLREHKDYYTKDVWYYIFYTQDLDIDFIREFAYRVNWYAVSDGHNFGKKLIKFIEEFWDKLYWSKMVIHITKGRFLKRWADKINWYAYTKYYNFTGSKEDEEFIRKFKDYLYFPLIDSSKFSKEFQEEIHQYLKSK